jgi:hypothetical protein
MRNRITLAIAVLVAFLGIAWAGFKTDTLTVTGAAQALSYRVNGSGGPTWTAGAGAPAASCAVGNIYSRTNGASNTSLYVCTATNTWTALLNSSSGITNSAGANVITKSDGTNVVASNITDNGTLVSVSSSEVTIASTSTGAAPLTISGAGQNSGAAITINATGTNGGVRILSDSGPIEISGPDGIALTGGSSAVVTATGPITSADTVTGVFLSGDVAGSAPAVSTCGTTPTQPAATDTNVAGQFSTGSGTTACTLTLVGTAAQIPRCLAAGGDEVKIGSCTGTAPVVCVFSALNASTPYLYHCLK